jgi:lysophospholipid acyltransferase
MPPLGQETSALKRLYDICTVIVSVAMVNYATVPFMVSTLDRSLKGWTLLGWYGHILIGGALLFYYAGGARVLSAMARKQGKDIRKVTPAASGATTPVAEKQFQVPPSFDQVVPLPAEK